MRAVGSTHSWSPLYPDEGNILIDGTGLTTYNGNKILLNEGTLSTETEFSTVCAKTKWNLNFRIPVVFT